jgi:AcrR family transcriptional regulator
LNLTRGSAKIGDVPRPTREQVLTEIRGAALRLFVEQGYDATTLAQVGASVGYSKSAMLYHFASKEALLAAALVDPVQRLREHVATTADTDLLTRIAGLVDLVLAHRHEAALLVRQSELLQEVAGATEVVEQLVEGLLGPEPSLEHQVAVHLALAGVADAARCFPDADPAQLRGPLLAVAARTLGLAAPADPTTR